MQNKFKKKTNKSAGQLLAALKSLTWNYSDLQFEQKANLFLSVVKGVVELYKSRISQRFHNLHLAFHVDPVSLFGRLHKLGRQTKTRLLFPTFEYRSEFTS